MEFFANRSRNIINLISDVQNNKIDKNNFNKEILVNTILAHFYFSKREKRENKIKEIQNKTYQSFFKLEFKTEQKEKQLFANIRDRKGKKMVEESIRANRENLLNELASKKDMRVFVEQTYNTYLPPKNTSLSINFQSNSNFNYNKKYIPDCNLQIQYLNLKQRKKDNRLISIDFIEPPFFPDYHTDSEENNDFDKESENKNEEENKNEKVNKIEEINKIVDINKIEEENKNETNEGIEENEDDAPMQNIESDNDSDNDSNIRENPEKEKENENVNENEELIDLIGEDDELLFYEEKLQPNEDPKKIDEWNLKIVNNDMISDFQYLKQKNKVLNEQVNELYYTLQQDKIIKSEMSSYLKNSEINYGKIAQQDHYHEFSKYLSEKSYKSYLKKMNYNYMLLMLLLYFDFENSANNYYDIVGSTKTMLLFVKKIILFVGISNTKVYDPIMHYISNKKGNFSFDDFLNCFMPIFDLPEKYQFYKYGFLLFLVKKKDEDVITLSNYRIFCNLIRGKLIYEEDICEDIIGKLIPIIKTKYPKDDPENLSYKHVSIILEFLVNYMYGG